MYVLVAKHLLGCAWAHQAYQAHIKLTRSRSSSPGMHQAWYAPNLTHAKLGYPESLWCYYSLLRYTSQSIHIKRVHKGILLGYWAVYRDIQGIAYWNDTGCLNFGGHSTLPSSPLPSTPHIQHTRHHQNTSVWKEGWDLPVRRRRRTMKGDREGRGREEEWGRERERENRVDQSTNCFIQLHTTQNLIPRQRNGMRVHTDCMPPTTAHCSVCVDSCLVAAELVASHHCGCGTSELRVWDGCKSFC